MQTILEYYYSKLCNRILTLFEKITAFKWRIFLAAPCSVQFLAYSFNTMTNIYFYAHDLISVLYSIPRFIAITNN